MIRSKNERTIEVLIHICIWVYVFGSPLLFKLGNETIDWPNYVRRLYFPVSSCVIFYVNYFGLFNRFFLKKKYKSFILCNALMLVAFVCLRDPVMQLLPPSPPPGHSRGERFHEPSMYMIAIFTLRSAVSLAFVSFLAVAVRLSLQWREAEMARQEAELGRSEAELKNLKNQINPHFLLNTLNNIYSLTAFDTDKAQAAIQQLSGLLRYILYENQQTTVALTKEADFLRTYISLMRIRLSGDVDVSYDVDIPADDVPQIAPLIFISLVENAFKHGISPVAHSFVSIALKVNRDEIQFSCLNSNFPKKSNDKSPGGIGLKQVESRLEHSYPGKYKWNYGVSEDGKTYFSQITIERK